MVGVVFFKLEAVELLTFLGGGRFAFLIVLVGTFFDLIFLLLFVIPPFFIFLRGARTGAETSMATGEFAGSSSIFSRCSSAIALSMGDTFIKSVNGFNCEAI